MIKRNDLILISGLLSVLFWTLESLAHVHFFPIDHTLPNINQHTPFWHEFLSPSAHELYMRILFFVLIMMFGIITQRIINKQRFNAKHHALTGLINSRGILETLSRYMHKTTKEHQAFTLILCKPRQLDLINRIVGFDHGNHLLLDICDRLKHHADEYLLGSWDKQHFVLLLPKNTSLTIDTFTQKLTQGFEENFLIADIPFHIELEIGLVDSADIPKAELAMQYAFKALNCAADSANGISQYRFCCDTEDSDYLAFVGELYSGIKNHQFQIYLQPKVRLRDEKTKGFEVLTRWHHPTKGIFSPGDFIPAAEKCLAIKTLTENIIQQTFFAIQKINTENKAIQFSINLSANNLSDASLVPFIKHLLATTNISSSMIIFEVTETALMIQPEQAKKTLDQLSSLGFSLSLDDFGTGYSSLAYLQQFNISEIKIDKCFIDGVGQQEKQQRIVENIIALGKSVNATLCAEGIECEEDFMFLNASGCDLGQGYYWSKPLPFKHFFQLHDN